MIKVFALSRSDLWLQFNYLREKHLERLNPRAIFRRFARKQFKREFRSDQQPETLIWRTPLSSLTGNPIDFPRSAGAGANPG